MTGQAQMFRADAETVLLCIMIADAILNLNSSQDRKGSVSAALFARRSRTFPRNVDGDDVTNRFR